MQSRNALQQLMLIGKMQLFLCSKKATKNCAMLVVANLCAQAWIFFFCVFIVYKKKVWAIYLFQCRRRTTSSSRKMQGQYLCLISSVSDSLIFRNRQHNMYIFEWFYETNSYFADHRRRCTLSSNFRLNAPTETSSFCVGEKQVKTAPWLFLQFFA